MKVSKFWALAALAVFLFATAGLAEETKTPATGKAKTEKAMTEKADTEEAKSEAATPEKAQHAKHKAHKSAAAASASMELAAVAVCKDVQGRSPVGDASTFSSDVGSLFCFTDVRNGENGSQVYHRWYVGDQMVNEIPVNVNGPRWRCWTKKTILSSWNGDCKVEIVNEEGDVLGTADFMLVASAEPTEEAAEKPAEDPMNEPASEEPTNEPASEDSGDSESTGTN